MKKLIFIIIALAITASPVQAREFEDAIIWPKWATDKCLETIYKIIQHEAGSTKDDEIFQFMTEQIIWDIKRLTCNGLTQWRWAIGQHPNMRIYKEVKHSVMKVLDRYPKMNFPKCSFIGMRADIPVWKFYGYNVEIGFEKTVGRWTVLGVGCK